MRHLYVHQYDVRLQPLRRCDGLGPIACLTDDVEIVFGLEDQPEARSHQTVRTTASARSWLRSFPAAAIAASALSDPS